MPLKASPEKIQITKMYERMQQRVMVDDPVLSKLIISLPRINSKSVHDFIRRQEALASIGTTIEKGHGTTNRGIDLTRCISCWFC